VATVSHRDEVEDLVRKGRDVERKTLADAVRLQSNTRVLVWDEPDLRVRRIAVAPAA